MEQKNQYDIIYLLDKEIGIDSGHDKERPCLIISIDIEETGGYVIPITSKFKSWDQNRMQYQLAFGSWIDLSNRPIKINYNQLLYSRLSDYFVDGTDIEELEYRFEKWIN